MRGSDTNDMGTAANVHFLVVGEYAGNGSQFASDVFLHRLQLL